MVNGAGIADSLFVLCEWHYGRARLSITDPLSPPKKKKKKETGKGGEMGIHSEGMNVVKCTRQKGGRTKTRKKIGYVTEK